MSIGRKKKLFDQATANAFGSEASDQAFVIHTKPSTQPVARYATEIAMVSASSTAYSAQPITLSECGANMELVVCGDTLNQRE